MKEIKREHLASTIKKAFEEGRDWCQLNTRHCYNLMINVDDATVWVNLMDENHWKVYQDDSIYELHSMEGTVEKMETHYLEDAISKLMSAGWSIN